MIVLKQKIRVFLSLFIFFVNSCVANDLDIVSNKKAMAEIVIPVDPNPIERKSALVLQDYVKRITGVSLEIRSKASGSKAHVIFVGNELFVQTKELSQRIGNEGFEIVNHGEHIYLRGGAGKGLLYGVYELIEKQFGARKYDQGPALVKQRDGLALPRNFKLRFEPQLIYRESHYPSSMDSEYLDWHHLHRFEDLWGLWGHSFFKIIPPERYFVEHPEYFAWTNGRRQSTQLCLTNKEVQAKAVSYFRKAIADNPDAMYWSIAPMDGRGNCTCDRCAEIDHEEGGPQGTLIRFVNTVAAHFPDQLFTTLAYGYTAEAPKKSKPRDNVYVMLSTIDATRELPLVSNPTAATFRRQLEQWSKLSSNLFVWDYTTQFTAYLNPFPMYDHFSKNIDYMSENGIKGIFEHGSGSTRSDMSVYASYIQAKSLWDPKIDQRQIEADFLKGYYGDAAGSIQDYIQQLLHARASNHAVLDIYGNPIASRNGYLEPRQMQHYRRTIEEARGKVAKEQVFLNRIHILELGLEYVELEQAKSYGKHALGFLQQTADGQWQVKAGWRNRVDQFLENSLRAGVHELSEVNGSLEEYRNQWSAIINKPYLVSLLDGRKPSFRPSYLEDYPANGDFTMTDGLLGGKDYSYNWLLFNGGNVELIFPLKSVTIVSSLELNFLLDPRHYLFLPNEIKIEASEDGSNYVVIGKQSLENSRFPGEEPMLYKASLALKQDKLNFLRIVIEFPKRVPDWFEGARNRTPLLAIDEIIVK